MFVEFVYLFDLSEHVCLLCLQDLLLFVCRFSFLRLKNVIVRVCFSFMWVLSAIKNLLFFFFFSLALAYKFFTKCYEVPFLFFIVESHFCVTCFW